MTVPLDVRGERLLDDSQRVVASDDRGTRHPRQHAARVVLDARRHPVPQFRRLLDAPAEGHGDHLMAEADTEKRDVPAHRQRNGRERGPSVLGPAGARRDHDRVGALHERLDIGRREMGRVAHVDLRPELAQIPDEGVDETVAVIEDDDACGHPTVTS
jgi:hypothetical protein